MDKLPISVIVPHQLHRANFFNKYCLPSIKANNPVEVLVHEGDQSAQFKRNHGAERATQPFLFFCDDDVILSDGHLLKLLSKIDGHDFAYSDYLAANHPTPGFLEHIAKEFNPVTLRQQNYVSTMSLIRRNSFPGFDEEIQRLQDWDLFLTIIDNGGTGVKVEDTSFIAFWLDKGITGNDDWNNAHKIVKRKHGI